MLLLHFKIKKVIKEIIEKNKKYDIFILNKYIKGYDNNDLIYYFSSTKLFDRIIKKYNKKFKIEVLFSENKEELTYIKISKNKED